MVKISKKFDNISWDYIQKTTQKQPKIELSAAMKTLEILKFGNYNSDINETWPRYVPPEHLPYTKKMRVSMIGWVGGASKKLPKNAIKLTKSRL